MVGDRKDVYTFNIPEKLSTCRLVVDGTVVGKDNREEKTREVADIRKYHIS